MITRPSESAERGYPVGCEYGGRRRPGRIVGSGTKAIQEGVDSLVLGLRKEIIQMSIALQIFQVYKAGYKDSTLFHTVCAMI